MYNTPCCCMYYIKIALWYSVVSHIRQMPNYNFIVIYVTISTTCCAPQWMKPWSLSHNNVNGIVMGNNVDVDGQHPCSEVFSKISASHLYLKWALVRRTPHPLRVTLHFTYSKMIRLTFLSTSTIYLTYKDEFF